MDTLDERVLVEVLLWEEWVCLDLVDSWNDASGLDDTLNVGWGEVGNTNRLDLAGLLEGDESTPCVGQTGLQVEVGVAVLGGDELVIGGNVAARWLKGNWPVDQVEIEVLKVELFEGVLVSLLDVLWLVCVVPQL